MPLDFVGTEQVVALPVEAVPDPAEIVQSRDLLVRTLAPMARADQIAFVMVAAGWSAEEIARALGVGREPSTPG